MIAMQETPPINRVGGQYGVGGLLGKAAAQRVDASKAMGLFLMAAAAGSVAASSGSGAGIIFIVRHVENLRSNGIKPVVWRREIID